MPILKAKGKSHYLEFTKAPETKALLETETLFDAMESACEAMLGMLVSENPFVERASVEVWVALRDLSWRMEERMESVKFMVDLGEKKVRQEYHDVLEGSGAES